MGLLVVGCGGPGDDPAPSGVPEGAEHVVNPAEGTWAPGEAWRLEEELRVGTVEGEGPEAWGTVRALAVDAHDRFWVLDNQAAEIRVFTHDGEHVRTVGRGGEGPGEIGLGATLMVSPHRTIWLHDARNARFTVYDTAGAYLRDHPIRSAVFLQGHRFGSDGRLLEMVGVARGEEVEVVLVRSRVEDDGSLTPVDTLPVPELPDAETMVVRTQQGQMMALRAAPLPFRPQPERVVDPRGFVWTTPADGSYRLIRHGLSGEGVRVVERAYEPVPVTPEQRAEALEPFEGTEVDLDEMPDHHPPMQSVYVARSGHLWVWRHVAPERMAWDVFGPEGTYLGEVSPPFEDGRVRLLTVEPDAVWVVWRNALDVSHVVRLALLKPGS